MVEDWAPIAAAILVLLGVPLGHWLQHMRERAQWQRDRRLGAYADLATASSELAAATETYGAVLANIKNLRIEFYLEAQNRWTETHRVFVAAQYRAVLVASNELAKLVELMSRVAGEMTEAAQVAGPEFAPTGQLLEPGDPDAPGRLRELGEESIALRNKFVKNSRRELLSRR